VLEKIKKAGKRKNYQQIQYVGESFMPPVDLAPTEASDGNTSHRQHLCFCWERDDIHPQIHSVGIKEQS